MKMVHMLLISNIHNSRDL